MKKHGTVRIEHNIEVGPKAVQTLQSINTCWPSEKGKVENLKNLHRLSVHFINQ